MTTIDMPNRTRIALFDLDHTLLPIDSDFTWTTFTNAKGWTDPEATQRQNDAFYADYKAGQLDMDAYTRFVTRAVQGLPLEQLRVVQAEYSRDYIQPHILPAALELLEKHRQAGDVLVLTTATNRFIAEPVGRMLGFADNHIVATELMHSTEGHITGAMRGPANLREGKVQHFAAWLTARGWQRDDVHVVFYSDSINDLPLLEHADVAVATNPDAQLHAIAAQRGWRIINLFTTV